MSVEDYEKKRAGLSQITDFLYKYGNCISFVSIKSCAGCAPLSQQSHPLFSPISGLARVNLPLRSKIEDGLSDRRLSGCIFHCRLIGK